MKIIEITQFKDGLMRTLKDTVAEESILHLVINSKITFDVIISPSDIKEFVIGNLYSERFIENVGEVTGYKEVIKNNLITVNIKLKNFEDKKIFLKKNYNIIWTECGSSGELTRLIDKLLPLKTKINLNAFDILSITNKIREKVDLFKQTGAFHYAFLFDSTLELLNYTYDIGRHNAVDKLIGGLVLKNVELEDKIIYVTGRVSSDIILKCLRAKIPVVVSRSAPLDNAVELANKYNICLIGFLRGKRFNIYSNQKAIQILNKKIASQE